MVFQDSVSSLNPRHPVETILTEPLQNFDLNLFPERRARVLELLEAVGLGARVSAATCMKSAAVSASQRITLARVLRRTPVSSTADQPVRHGRSATSYFNLLVDLQLLLDQFPTCSSATTSRWCTTSPTGWRR